MRRRVHIVYISLAATIAGCQPGPATTPADAGVDADAVVMDSATGPDAALDGGGSPDCGEHGTLHGDHCDCDLGYVEEQGECVEIDACVGDDPSEPDDRVRDAVASSGVAMERWLCPSDVDHVAVDVEVGEQLSITALFLHDEVDVDVAVWSAGTDPRFDRPMARAVSQTDDEQLVVTATRPGTHIVRVYSDDPGAQGAYRLEIEVVTPPE